MYKLYKKINLENHGKHVGRIIWRTDPNEGKNLKRYFAESHSIFSTCYCNYVP